MDDTTIVFIDRYELWHLHCCVVFEVLKMPPALYQRVDFITFFNLDPLCLLCQYFWHVVSSAIIN